MTGHIATAVSGSVSVRTHRKKPSWWNLRRWGHSSSSDLLDAEPWVDEGSILRAVGLDSVAAARALDENSVPAELPLQRVADEALNLQTILGTAAHAAFAAVQQSTATAMATARTAKRNIGNGLMLVFLIVIVIVESSTMRLALGDAFALTGDLMPWVTAIGIAAVANGAGYATAVAWMKSLPPSAADDDGVLGRSVLVGARIVIVLSLCAMVAGVVWTRILYTEESSQGTSGAGLLEAGPNTTIAHLLVIAGIMMLAASVSFTLKAVDMVGDSARFIRPDVGTQRALEKLVEHVEALHSTLRCYPILEERSRVFAALCAAAWEEQFLAALAPDTRDAWLASAPPAPAAMAGQPAPWVHELERKMDEHLAKARAYALPILDHEQGPPLSSTR